MTEVESDSALAVLHALEKDRGTKLLPAADYVEMRQAILDELCRGPHLRKSTLITFGVVGLILFVFLLIGVGMILSNGPSDWLLAAASGACLSQWGFFMHRYVTGVRRQSHLSLPERLEEIEALRRHQLITQLEYERLYAAIHSSRSVSLVPDA